MEEIIKQLSLMRNDLIYYAKRYDLYQLTEQHFRTFMLKYRIPITQANLDAMATLIHAKLPLKLTNDGDAITGKVYKIVNRFAKEELQNVNDLRQIVKNMIVDEHDGTRHHQEVEEPSNWQIVGNIIDNILKGEKKFINYVTETDIKSRLAERGIILNMDDIDDIMHQITKDGAIQARRVGGTPTTGKTFSVIKISPLNY